MRTLKTTTAIAWLESRLLTPARAVDNLTCISSMARCVTVFEHFFPKEFAAFRSLPITRSQVRVAIIEKFHELVSTKLFPILDYFADEAGIDQFDLTINIYPSGSEWYEEDTASYDDLTRAILLGAGALTEQGEIARYDIGVDWDVLSRLAGKRRPLCRLPECVRILGHCTLNDFLDFGMDDLYSGYVLLPEWSIEQTEALCGEWAEAKKMLGHWKELMIWTSGNQSRFDLVMGIIAESCGRDGQSSVRVKTGRPLIDILT
ncbi:MAG: hypothetical protein L0229_20475 [Blastocatellia bacterium]|nr:hypothetical protein [Blastocatellia bacterium]